MHKNSAMWQFLSHIAMCFSYIIVAVHWVLIFAMGLISRTVTGVIFWMFVITCGIRIRGFRKALTALRNGKLVIIVNHPSWLEPVMLYALFWPWSLIPRLAIWSMPDKKMLPFWTRWFFRPWRCFAFNRKNAHEAGKASRRAVTAIIHGETVVIHPEGGRTYKGTEFVSSSDGKRCIRRIKTNAHRIICDAHAQVLPIWIERMPGKWQFISIYIGTLFDWGEFHDANDDRSREVLEEKILGAGK